VNEQAAGKLGISGESKRGLTSGAKQAAEKGCPGVEYPESVPRGLKPTLILKLLMYGLKPVPFTVLSFSASCEVVPFHDAFEIRE